MSYVRPSLADRAEKCGMVVELAEKHPEGSPAAEYGTAVDAESLDAFVRGAAATNPDARAVLDWLVQQRGVGGFMRQPWVHQRVTLRDPETGDVLTEGEPDVQFAADPEPSVVELTTVDVKKREQFDAGLLADPDDGLQMHGYSTARGLEIGATRYRNIYLLFGDGEVEPVVSRWFERAEWWDVIRRYRALAEKPRIPVPGQHCAGCYSKWHCDAFRARAALAVAALGQEVGERMTDEQAAELAQKLTLAKKWEEQAKTVLQAHYRDGGRIEADGYRYAPVAMKGRATVDSAALKRDGLAEKYTRRGAPYEQWRWLRVR